MSIQPYQFDELVRAIECGNEPSAIFTAQNLVYQMGGIASVHGMPPGILALYLVALYCRQS